MDTIQILAQANPNAGILTTFYTVPVATSTVASSIIVCNISSSGDQFSISIAVGGATDTPEQYLFYTTPIETNDTFIATIGITLATTDQVRVWSLNGGLAFNLLGVQIT